MKKRISVLALMLAMVMLLAACGAQENKEAATNTPAPTEAPTPTPVPKTEEELNLERDTAAVKLSVEMLKTMMATAGEKAAAEEEGSKLARYYTRISKTDVNKAFRAIVLTPTDEQFQTVKTITGIDAEYKTAPALAKFVNLMSGPDYTKAAEEVAAEADASAVGENVIVLLPCQDVVVVSIHDGKATSSLFWGTDTDLPVEMLPTYTAMLGITDLGFRNYDAEALKTMLGE